MDNRLQFKNLHGGNKLHDAVAKRDPKEIKRLLELGYNDCAPNTQNDIPIVYAAKNECWECVLAFVEDMKIAHSVKTYMYGYALLLAVEKHQNHAVEKLLQANVHTKMFRMSDQNTPLHAAILKDNTEAVRLLIKYNADRYIFNKDKKTPYQLSCETDNKLIKDMFQKAENKEKALPFINARVSQFISDYNFLGFLHSKSKESKTLIKNLKEIQEKNEPLALRCDNFLETISIFAQKKGNVKSRAMDILREHHLIEASKNKDEVFNVEAGYKL